MIVLHNLYRIRKARGLTQKELASLVGVSESMICQYENCTKGPSFETALKIAEVLDCESADLVSQRTGLLDSIENKKIPASDNGDGKSDESVISDYDKRFLEWFHSLPEGKRKAILISQDAPEDLL